MSNKSKQLNREYAEFISEKAGQLTDRINNRANNMERDTMVWLCRALAAVVGIIGLLYIVLFISRFI